MFSELEKLKRKARKHYRKYFSEFDKKGLGCGHSLAQEISPALSEQARLFNETMDKIEAIDSNCPKSRL